MDSKELGYWVGFSLIPGIGHVKFAQLENYFGNLENTWQAGPADLWNAGLDGGSLKAVNAENVNLARRIMQKCALISEYPLGTKPRADNFHRRNRIMSGMSLGVLVTEAGETSGAMITAHLALEQNREVFAVPGSILSPTSSGTNRLIREGAKLGHGYTDILEELNLTAVARQMEIKEIIPPSDTESLLLEQLGTDPVHIDEVCRKSRLPVATVSSTLAMMELKGLVRQMGATNYVLSREAREEYKVRVE